jgi:hypothetical protein
MMRLTRGVKPERYGAIFYSSSDRQPKCELLYIARNEAIGVPLLSLRQPGHGKVKHGDGYLIQVANRPCVEYVEPHRKAVIEVDFGNSAKAKHLLAILEDRASIGSSRQREKAIEMLQFFRAV